MAFARRFVTFVCLLVCSINVFAQSAANEAVSDDTAAGRTSDSTQTARRVPRVVRFGGTLHTASGEARTGTVGLTFAIYVAAQGGVPLWVETQNLQLDEQGRYSAILGRAQSEGLPIALFASGEARWLGVREAQEGSVEQPRVMLVSVPYALAAGDAQSLNGRPASDFQLTRAAAAGDAALEGGQAAGIETSGAVGSTVNTVGRLAKFTAADTIGNSAITDGGGLIGINNANPQYELDVVGAAVIGLATERFAFRSGSMSFNRNVNTGAIFDGAKHAYQIQHTGSATAAGDNLAFQVYGPSGATIAPDALSISGEGYVGVATTTPILPLDVRGAAVIGLGPERFSFRGGSMAFNRNATNGVIFNPNRHAYQFEQTGSLTAANDNLSVQVYGPNGVNITPNALAIVGSGNVGIGTSTPTQKLQVAGTVYSSSGGFRFPDGTTQTTAAVCTINCTGTISAVTAGAGLTGGGSTGSVSLAIGTVPNASLAGTYASAVTFSNAGNAFSGSGAGLTTLSANNISAGTLNDGRLSSNVAFVNTSNTFTSQQIFRKDVSSSIGPSLVFQNNGGGGGAGGAIDFNGYDTGGQQPTLRLRSLDDGNYSSNFTIATKDPGANGNPLTERLRVTSSGDVKVGGMLRLGVENGTADAPEGSLLTSEYKGLVVRRLASTSTESSKIVALTDQILLVRDGSNAGFRIADIFVVATHQSFGCIGVTSTGATVGRAGVLPTGGSAVLWSDAQNVVYFTCSFGDTYNAKHATQVVLQREAGDYYWLGTVTSTVNQ